MAHCTILEPEMDRCIGWPGWPGWTVWNGWTGWPGCLYWMLPALFGDTGAACIEEYVVGTPTVCTLVVTTGAVCTTGLDTGDGAISVRGDDGAIVTMVPPKEPGDTGAACTGGGE